MVVYHKEGDSLVNTSIGIAIDQAIPRSRIKEGERTGWGPKRERRLVDGSAAHLPHLPRGD